MKYLFILGRNPVLSTAEVKFFLKKEGIDWVEEKRGENYILVDIQGKVPEDAISKLGGIIAIGEILAEGDFDHARKSLEGKILYYGKSNKLMYSVWNFSEKDYNFLSEYLKKRFRSERLKASEKPLTGSLNMQEGGARRIVSSKVDEEFFALPSAYGKIIQKSDYSAIEKRDMKKPERRESLAISPRLAKIMINLSEAKKGETILDPFCGIGVILQEAVIQGINVIGVDSDERALAGAGRNLEWVGGDASRKLIQNDSRRITPPLANSIVTEPWLGETIRKTPTEQKARETLRKYEALVSKVFNNLKKRISGKIVFTSPLILLHNKKRVGCNIENILSKTNLKLLERFEEFRQGQIVGREIFVLGR